MCIVCAGVDSGLGEGLAAAAKPSFAIAQIIAQLDRWNVGWTNGVVTYAFFQNLTGENANDPDYAGFEPFTILQKQAVEQIFALFGDVANLTFVAASDNGSSANRLTFANSDTMPDYVWGHAVVSHQDQPGEGRDPLTGAEVWVNSSGYFGTYAPGSYNFMALMHEVMHGLGVPHPGDYNATGSGGIKYESHAEYRQDSRQYTVMSYFSETKTGAAHSGEYARTPLLHDILILQHIYGVNTTTRVGDTVYGFNSNAGATYTFAADDEPVLAIWDAGGVDTIDLSGYMRDAVLDLREGSFSSFNGLKDNMAIAHGAVIENGSGGLGNDSIIGNGVANVLWGGGGHDEMRGGAGDDTYHVSAGGSAYITETAGQGDDIVYSAGDVGLNGEIEKVVLTGTADASVSGTAGVIEVIGNAGDNVFYITAQSLRVVGGAGDDTYHLVSGAIEIVELANGGSDTLVAYADYSLEGTDFENLVLDDVLAAGLRATGNHLSNTITGNTRNNVLDGRSGADVMRGMGGDDVYIVDHAGDVVDEGLGDGLDHVLASVSFVLSDWVEWLTLTGSADINATGNWMNNLLTGNAGRNVLIGGAGNDTYRIQSLDDRVVEVDGEGIDTIEVAISYSLSGIYVENLTLTGTARVDGTGNTLNNLLIGNAGVNLLTGGRGDDTYVIQTVGDRVVEKAGEGYDHILSSVSFDLAGAYVEALTLTGTADLDAVGNSLANRLTGNSGRNVLDGRGGADLMLGGLGDDTYYVDHIEDQVVELSGEGADRVFASVTFSIAGAQVERLTLAGVADIDATGNELDNALVGNSGDNELRGGRGADDMAGGLGDDIYFVDDIRDRVFESSGQGRDEVRSSVSYSLGGRFVEVLTLTGSADIDGTGNSLANVLTGNSGVNRLIGGGGNDIYYVQTEGDVAVEHNGQGSDHVYSSVSYDLRGQYVEHLTLVGEADLTAVGNSLANFLAGNAGDNRIWGAGGQDRLTGGGGADTFVYLSVKESTAALSDRITDLSWNDSIDLSRIDADTTRDGDQAFDLVDVFSGAAGQATLTLQGGVTFLNLDIDGDGSSDFLLRLQGDHRDHDNWAW
ncbi:M10 family metallopeptidase C-terminal domain-containing protein [Brevundimonas sp.]|uniref:M10 family metallopeptidase C-terminal domain-containing protein n=1 Tax=Brevundimonas sp. TaxID=1871086 RepID=UPI0035B30866